MECDLSTHVRSEAIRQLREILDVRIAELKERGEFSAVVRTIGKKVVNQLRSDMSPTVPTPYARKVLMALGFGGEELNKSLLLHTIICSPVSGARSAKRDFRNRLGGPRSQSRPVYNYRP